MRCAFAIAFWGSTLLAQDPPARKTDVHGDPLPRGAVARIGTTRFLCFDGEHFSFSPDGKLLALPSGIDEVRFWDLASGKPAGLLIVPQHYDLLLFSPDSKNLVTRDRGDGSVLRLWDIETGKVEREFVRKNDTFGRALFSPDGKLLAASCRQKGYKELALWDVKTGELRVVVEADRVEVGGFAFSPDSQTLATAGGEKVVRLWDTAGKLRASLPEHKHSFQLLAFSPDGKTLTATSHATT